MYNNNRIVNFKELRAIFSETEVSTLHNNSRIEHLEGIKGHVE